MPAIWEYDKGSSGSSSCIAPENGVNISWAGSQAQRMHTKGLNVQREELVDLDKFADF